MAHWEGKNTQLEGLFCIQIGTIHCDKGEDESCRPCSW